MAVKEKVLEQEMCYHCGEECSDHRIEHDEKHFCCDGCKAVYELFQDDHLRDLYKQNVYKKREGVDLEFLDNPEIIDQLIDAKTDKLVSIRLKLPDIHCSSCIYLLENLHKIEPSIISIRTNFQTKEANIKYNPANITLREVAELLTSVGYKPDFESKEGRKSPNNALSIKIGVAAFCFGNIMLLSFPEYLGYDLSTDKGFQTFFAYLNVLLSLPILFYSATDYFSSAWKGLTHGFINIDVPIALGIIVLFARSSYEIFTAIGPGYLDSLSGLIFFLLIGKWFQNKTYEDLSFERDYKSYFPLAIFKKVEQGKVSTPINDLKPGDIIIIRNQEIIPADGLLLSSNAKLDYSFVTGEEKPQSITKNELVYAGGRHLGQSIEVKVTKPSSQSYLTNLWNNEVFQKEKSSEREILINRISKYFTMVILAIGFVAFTYWSFVDVSRSWEVFTSVLIVACPCALALAAPFTNGHSIRILGRNSLYLKSAQTAELLPKAKTVVFDKTGTLTVKNDSKIHYFGQNLTNFDIGVIKSMTGHSTHPVSVALNEHFSDVSATYIDSFMEKPGKGIKVSAEGIVYKLGSSTWLGAETAEAGGVYLSINDELVGYFLLNQTYRANVKKLIDSLAPDHDLVVLSGDNDNEKEQLEEIFPEGTEMKFKQKPEDKLQFIKERQDKGEYVMMLGDGLNDAGALRQANIGIAVTEDTATFSPASDGIIEGKRLTHLAKFIDFANSANRIIILSFIVSFLYNAVGISLAVSGLLTPIIAAILMPLSSVSVVAFTTISSNFSAKKFNL